MIKCSYETKDYYAIRFLLHYLEQEGIPMVYQIIAILILITFYTFYFAKIIIQKKQSIKTNQMGIGNKPKNVVLIE